MVKLVALVLLVLWICAGVLHLALDESDEQGDGLQGDALQGEGIEDALGGLGGGVAADNVAARGDPDVGLATQAKPRGVRALGISSEPALPGWLREAVGRADPGWSSIGTALHILSRRRPLFNEHDQQAFLALARRPEVPQNLRVLAAILALSPPGAEAEKTAVLLAALQMDEAFQSAPMEVVLAGLQEMGETGSVFLPCLLAMGQRPSAIWNSQTQLLRVCLAIAPDDPRVMDLLLCALGRRGSAAQFVRKKLLGGTRSDRLHLVSLLETASGPARVNGVRFLLEAGMPGRELGHVLLPALQDKSQAVRTGAVTLLARSGLVVADIVPVIETLLADDDQTCWLTAIEALGVLGRMPGDKGDVVNLLFAAVRMPNTKVRTVAVQTLLMYDGENRRIIPILADLLNDTEPQVRREAVDGLGELSAEEDEARRHLQAALGDTDQTVREVAQYWLEEEDAGEK